MKQFFSFVKKEFYHIFRDRRTMLILLVMPVVLIILFGFAIATEVSNIRIAVYAPTQDELTRQITERFAANAYYHLVDLVRDPQQIDVLFKENKADIVLFFQERFQENLLHTGKAAVQLIIDGSEPNTASTISSYTSNILAVYQQELLSSTQNRASFAIIPVVKLLYNPQMKSAYNFVPGVMGLILMLICAMMTSISIVREKERGTMEILLVSPARPISIILAKAVPYFLISSFNLVTILLLSVYLLKVPVAGSLFWLSILSLVYIFTALSLGLLISSLVNQQVVAMLFSSMALMLPTIALSGMIFPVENMPAFLRWFSALIPARWYIAAIKKIMIEGLSISYAWKELGILCLMAIVLIGVSLSKFKNRLE
ncbi:MAG: ABC transporter permease [Bacteroides sp.]|nr:ABC transporter permease [Bacteroides sp.]